MHLLLATVYESTRLLPAGPLLQRCSLQRDLKLQNGATIPAGAIVVAPVQLLQTDEFIWGHGATEFNPYRFLSKVYKGPVVEDSKENSYVLKDVNENDSFLSFGSGIRSCIGREFSVFGIASIIASLLEVYEITLQPGCSVNLKPSMENCVIQLLPSPKINFLRRSA